MLPFRANAIWPTACQNAAYLAAIRDLELRFAATTWGRGAIWEVASTNRDRRSLAISVCNRSQSFRSQTFLQKELFFGVRSPSNRDRILQTFRSLTDRPLELHLNIKTASKASALQGHAPIEGVLFGCATFQGMNQPSPKGFRAEVLG